MIHPTVDLSQTLSNPQTHLRRRHKGTYGAQMSPSIQIFSMHQANYLRECLEFFLDHLYLSKPKNSGTNIIPQLMPQAPEFNRTKQNKTDLQLEEMPIRDSDAALPWRHIHT